MMTDPWNEAAFATGLRSPIAELPEGLAAWNRAAPHQRFAVYRNNVRGALVEALAVRYPVVQRLVGDEFFRIMAREFAIANLPASPVLISYGENFPDFVAAFEPAASLSYLPDVARLESAYWQAYHAGDHTPADLALFQLLDPAQLADARLSFIAASSVVTSPHPIFSIWQTNSRDETVSPVDLSVAEDALISRPGLSTEVRKLPPGAASFITALMTGSTISEAAEAGFESSPAFDFARNIGGLIQARIVKGLA